MRRRHMRAAIGAALAVAALTAAPAGAQQPGSTPGGPWEQPNQNESLSAIRDYDELVATVEQLIARNPGTAKLTYSPFHAKGSGRAIPVVTIGSAAGGPGKVDVMLDLHHQGSKTDADGQMVTGSTLWPNATATADQLGIRPQFDQVVFRSKQVVSTLVQAVHQYGYANFSKYCGTTPPGTSRNAYGLLGSASVLLEMRGDIGQKSNGYIAKTAYVAAASVIDALADGSLSHADVSVAEALQLTPGETGCPPAEEGDE